MHRIQKKNEPREVLRSHGFRATNTRIALLSLLQKKGVPFSIQEILACWRNAPNQTTLYRILTDLSKAGVVRRVDLNTGIAHFEYTPNRPHHHHIVCTNCGVVEDVVHCGAHTLEHRVATQSQAFTHIDSHTLEFFGRCNRCTV